MNHRHELRSIPDDELLRRLSELLQQSRRVESELVAHIGEVDQRRLYAGQGCSSMFSYSTEVLNLSEAEAYMRIGVARAARKFPVILEMLADGRLHLSGAAKLVPHLTEANCEGLLARASRRTKRQIEELLCEVSPKSDVPPVIRKLPAPREATGVQASDRELRPDAVKNEMPREEPSAAKPAEVVRPAPPPMVEPLAPARYKVQFTATASLREKLERLQELMGEDLAAVIEAAVTEKLERLESKRYAKTKTPRTNLEETDTSPSSRHIPAAVKREVWERDGGQCTFLDALGRRCRERRWLEFHHDHPFGRGGDHSPENVRLLCRAHNGYFAERDYGKRVMARYRRRDDRVSEPVPVYGIGQSTRSHELTTTARTFSGSPGAPGVASFFAA